MSPQLSKFEYLEVFVDKAEWRDGRGKTGTLPVPDESKRSGMSMGGAEGSGLTERMAKDGWLLASTIHSGKADVYRLVFRRTKR